MEAHKSFKTPERLAPLAIISRVRFSAANRDSACDGFATCSPCLDSGLAGGATPAASPSCISRSGLRRGSGELIRFSVLGPVYDPLVITYASRTAHATGAGSHSRLPWIEIVYDLPCAYQLRGPASSCL